MKRIDKYITFDDKEFLSPHSAEAYLDKLYGDKLSSLGYRFSCIISHVKKLEFIDENLEEFVTLLRIKENKELLEDE